MNKRQKKKLKKKLGCKSYYKYRQKVLIQKACRGIKNADEGCFNIVHIIDSKKMNLKHPHSVKVFTNCYPSTMNGEPKEVSVEFSADTSYTENVVSYKKLMEAWLQGIKDPEPIASYKRMEGINFEKDN